MLKEKYTLIYIAQLDTKSEFNVLINKKEYEELTLRDALYKMVYFLRNMPHTDPICRLEIKWDGYVIWNCLDRKALNQYFN